MKAGWEIKTLDNLCDILDTQRKPITKCDRIAGEYPYYGATGMLDYVENYIFDEKLVLVGEDGAKWTSGENTAFSVEGKCWVNNHAHVLRPNRNKINDNWLIYFLVHSDLSEFVSGLTVPKLNQGSLKAIPIPLPPLPEQKRLVTLLDEAFESIATAKANAEQNLKNARALYNSVLENLFSSLDDVETVELGELINTLTDYHANGGYEILKQNVELLDTEDFAWMVRSTDFEKNFKNEKRYITKHAYDFLTKSRIFGGELIMSKIGNAGNLYLMPEITRPCSLAMNLFLIRLDESKASNKYVYRYLKSMRGEIQIQSKLKGATTQTITKESVRSLKIPKLSRETQDYFVSKLEDVELETQRLEALYSRKISALDELKKALLHRAFSGEL